MGPSSPCRVPQFSIHVYCGQTARWIKMALGMKVGLSPGHIVLDGDAAPAPQEREQSPFPQFSAHFYYGKTAGWMTTPRGTGARSHLTQSRLGRGLPPYQVAWHLNPSSHLATTDICQKLGNCVPLGEGKLGPHLTQCHVGRGLPPYQVAS